MQRSSTSVSETLTEIGQRRPALLSAINTFSALLCARAAAVPLLAALPDMAHVPLPQWEAQRAEQHQSLLAGWAPQGLDNALHLAATEILPAITALKIFQPVKEKLESFFLSPDPEKTLARTALMGALLAADEQAFIARANEADLPPEILELPAEFIFSAVLRAVCQNIANRPWETVGAWSQGYCPVCGSFPIMSWLDRPAFDEKNAYLAGGGGKKYLYCGMCGTNWRFQRGVCPACSAAGNGTIEILREHDARHGERLEWCTKCKSYCPSLDLRECLSIPDMDAAALGMLHLDIVAAEKKLQPLRLSFWNQF